MRQRTPALCAVLTSAWLLTAAVAHAQAPVRVTMASNRTDLPVGESVVVQISVQANTTDDAEVELPEFEGFDVVRRSIERPMQFSFGFGQGAPVVSASTTYTFVLVANTTGRIRIPPARVKLAGKTYQSESLTLDVQGGAAAPADPNAQAQAPANAQGQGQAQPGQAAQQAVPAQNDPAPQPGGDAAVLDAEAFLRTVIDKTEPYEGEQVTTTFYLYTRRNLQQSPSVLSEPTTAGFWTRDLLNPNSPLQPTRQVVNGRAYWVYVLRRFAAFPLKSGELTVGSMALNISRQNVFDIFNPGAAAGDLQRKSVPLLVRVKPLPTEGRPQGEVAVGQYELSAQLDRAQLATGDAVTLTATVRGVGNISTVRLPSPVLPDVEVLQPETRDVVESPQDLVQGTRTFAWLLVPKKPGTHTIAGLVLEVFNPNDGTYQRVTSQPLTLTAAGNAQPSALTAADAPSLDAAPTDTTDSQIAWPPLRAKSALSRRQPTIADELYFAAILFGAPVAWLLALLLPWAVRRMRAGAARDTQRVAQQQATAKLEAAKRALAANNGKQLHVELAGALSLVLQARCGEPVTGLTRPQLRALLERCGIAAQPAREVLEVLERCDVARFSPVASSESDLQAMITRVERLLSALASSASPKPSEAQS